MTSNRLAFLVCMAALSIVLVQDADSKPKKTIQEIRAERRICESCYEPCVRQCQDEKACR